MQLSKKSQVVVLLSVIAIAAILIVPSMNNFNLFTMAVDPTYHTNIPLADVNNLNTVHNKEDVWEGNNAPGTGWPHKELIADIKYVTTFTGNTGSDAYSERISIQGNLFEKDLFECNNPEKAYYRISIKEGGRDWAKIVDLNTIDTRIAKVTGDVGWKTCNYNPIGLYDQRIDVAAIELQLIGSHVGALKVEFIVKFNSCYPWGGTWEKAMSTDYCYLISGNGKLNVQGYQNTDVPMFEIGDTVPIQVSADYSGPTLSETGRWQLWAYPLRGGAGRMLKEWNYDYFRETYNWKLPSDAWVKCSSDSKWRIELHNTLFSSDAVMINTIDVRANAPPTPTVAVIVAGVQTASESAQVKLGEPITININGGTNSLTNESLQYFWVRGIYSNNNYQFLYTKVIIPGATTECGGKSSPTSATYKFTPPNAGTFKLQIWSHDASGRETEKPAEITIEVYQGNKPIPPIVTDDLALWLVIAIIAIAGIGIGMYVLQNRKKGGGMKFKIPKFNMPKWRKKK
jgi:hypothetical protein